FPLKNRARKSPLLVLITEGREVAPGGETGQGGLVMAPRPKSSNVFGILALSVLALAAGVILMTNVDSNVRAASGGDGGDEKSARGWRLGEAGPDENLNLFPGY